MKTWKLIISALALSSFAAAPAMAKQAKSTTTVKKVTDAETTATGPDIDQMITNNMMRASSGSKSRWSLSMALNYNGGSVESPLAEDRPNIAATTGTVQKSLLNGTVSGKFNFDSQNSLSAGVGVRWIAPLKSGSPSNYSGDRIDAVNPYLTYQYLYKWAGIQSVFQVTPTVYTNTDLVKEGYVANVGINQDNIYEVGHTGLSLGVYICAQGNTYNKTGPFGTPGTKGYLSDVRTDQSDYSFCVDPFVEYQLTDKINLRAVANTWNYEHIRSESRAMTFKWDKVYQSIGVGISITRNIFLYPNLQFLPDDIRADRTNVALNTNINLF